MNFWDMDKETLLNYINNCLSLGEEVHEDAIQRLHELNSQTENDTDKKK